MQEKKAVAEAKILKSQLNAQKAQTESANIAAEGEELQAQQQQQAPQAGGMASIPGQGSPQQAAGTGAPASSAPQTMATAAGNTTLPATNWMMGRV